jgi:hypothetical protein
VDDELLKVGEPIPDPPPSVFELVGKDHVPFVNPKTYGLSSAADLRDCINPADYYVTSGDAVEKAKALERDIWHLAGQLRKRVYAIIEKEHGCNHVDAQAKFRDGIRPSSPKRFHEYEAAVWKAAGQAVKMRNALLKAKGVNCFLETEWERHKLLCIPKNPRTPRKPIT